MSEVELFEKLSARLDSSDAKAASRFESLSARLDLMAEKLGAISGRLERMEIILDGEDKEGRLITRVGRHQT